MAGLEDITIYTDGACIGNPGPGGYGAILQLGERERELAAGYRLTTNNRMELMAPIAALEALKRPCRVVIHSDSQYVVRAMTEGWARDWQARGWRRKTKEPAINPDLWQRLLIACDQHDVTFRWVKGHAGHPLNERVDRLATQAAATAAVLVDDYYEQQLTPSRTT